MTEQAISVTCPNGHPFRVKQNARGRRVKCPECATVTMIPNDGSIATERRPIVQPNRTLPAAPPSTAPTSLQHKKLDWLTLSLAGGCCFFFLTTVVLLATLLFRGENTHVVAANNSGQPTEPLSTPTSLPKTAPNPPTRQEGEAAEPPKPVPPDEDTIEQQIEPSLRGTEAMPVEGTPGVYIATLSIGEIQVTLASPIIWLAEGSNHHEGDGFCSVKIIGPGQESYEDHGVLNVGGKPVIVTKSAGSNHFSIEPKTRFGNWHTFKQSGNTFLAVKIGDEQLWVPFEIREIPYPTGTPSSKILTDLGFPASKKSHYTSWPDTKSFDGIIYSPSANESIIAAEHWKFESLPHAVIAIVNDRLHEVGSYADRER
jgi:hypothetical protein